MVRDPPRRLSSSWTVHPVVSMYNTALEAQLSSGVAAKKKQVREGRRVVVKELTNAVGEPERP